MRRGSPARALTAVAALCLIGSCSPAPTQVVVRLATDLSVPDELDAIRLQILDDEGDVVREQELLELDGALGDGRFHEIATFGLVPRGGDSGRRFEVRASARLGGRELFTTRARSSFLTEQTIRLDLYVPRLCIAIAATCQPDETCGVSGCVDPEVDPTTLPSNEERPPTDPVDPRQAAPGDPLSLRALHPLTGERVSTLNPRLEVSAGAGIESVVIHYCDDPSCAGSAETPGTFASVGLRPGRRIHHWRATGIRSRDGAMVQSPTFWFYSRRVDRGPDVACGQIFDADGDAVPDLVVGAPGTGTTGAAYLFYGNDGAPSIWASDALAVPAGALRFGASIGVGDIDGDGHIELAVGAPDTADGGRVILYDPEDSFEPIVALEPQGGAITQRFGETVAGVGDVNGDGFADMAFTGADAMGRTYLELWLGSAAGLVPTLTTRPFDSARLVVTGGGDRDDDGYDDFVIGAPDVAPGGWAYLFPGSADVAGTTLADAVPVGMPLAGSGYGTSVAFGDAAGDGRCDVMIGAPDDAAGALTFSFDGGDFETLSVTGLMAGDAVGSSIVLADLDDDGLDDLISTRTPIREIMSLYVIRGREIDGAVLSFESLSWTMPDGTGTARIGALGNTGGADEGIEIVAAEEGFGLSLLTEGLQLGDFPLAPEASEAGASIR